MEPENTPLERENQLPNHHFQVRAVNLRGCTWSKNGGWAVGWYPWDGTPVPLIINPIYTSYIVGIYWVTQEIGTDTWRAMP